MNLERLVMALLCALTLVTTVGCSDDPVDDMMPPEVPDPGSAPATNTCVGQPSLSGDAGAYLMDAFPGGQENFSPVFAGTGDCFIPGEWAADSVVCFVPNQDCTINVSLQPRTADRIAGMISSSNSCQTNILEGACLAGGEGGNPGSPFAVNDLGITAGQVICVVTRTAGNGGGLVDVLISGLEECGGL